MARLDCAKGGGVEKKNHNLLCAMTHINDERTLCFLDSGVGAGIDSYYEYLLKAYILLGDDQFLQRFNIVSTHDTHLLSCTG